MGPWYIPCYCRLLHGVRYPIANTLISKAVPVECRGVVFGAVSSVAMMGNVLGPVISGMIARTFGYGAVFWTTAAIFFVAALFIYRNLVIPSESDASQLSDS